MGSGQGSQLKRSDEALSLNGPQIDDHTVFAFLNHYLIVVVAMVTDTPPVVAQATLDGGDG